MVPPDDSVVLTSAFDGVLCDVKVAAAPEMPHQPHPGWQPKYQSQLHLSPNRPETCKARTAHPWMEEATSRMEMKYGTALLHPT